MRRRGYFFHCTDRPHGQRWTARRIAPLFIGKDEPPTPRLCVAPTVAGCFTARLFQDGADVRVYRTAKERGSVAPVGVYDACITGERWLIPPVEMELQRVMPAPLVDEMQEWARRMVLTLRHGLPAYERLLAYRRVLNVLEREAPEWVERWERPFVNRGISYFRAKGAQNESPSLAVG